MTKTKGNKSLLKIIMRQSDNVFQQRHLQLNLPESANGKITNLKLRVSNYVIFFRNVSTDIELK